MKRAGKITYALRTLTPCHSGSRERLATANSPSHIGGAGKLGGLRMNFSGANSAIYGEDLLLGCSHRLANSRLIPLPRMSRMTTMDRRVRRSFQ
jgi:hypothetical protein